MTPLKKRQEVRQSCATARVAKIPRSPPAPSGGGRGNGTTKKEQRKMKNRQSCAAIEWPDYPDRSPALSGGSVGRTEYAGTTPSPAQNSEDVSCATMERPDYPDQPRH